MSVLTVFNLTDVANEKIADGYLKYLAAAYRRKLVLVFDLVLKPSKLFLLPPVIERRHEDDDDDGGKNGDTFDPSGFGFRLVDRSCSSEEIECDVQTTIRRLVSEKLLKSIKKNNTK